MNTLITCAAPAMTRKIITRAGCNLETTGNKAVATDEIKISNARKFLGPIKLTPIDDAICVNA